MLKCSFIFKQCDSQNLPFKLIKAMNVNYPSNKELHILLDQNVTQELYTKRVRSK